MTTPAQGNLSGSSGKQPDGGFEASGLSPEEAERLAAAFKPSWELDEAPFTQGNGGMDAAQIESLSREGDSSRMVAPHAPPQRVETHEPEVSVIIDRSITAAEMDAQRPPPAAVPSRPAPVPQAPFAAPVFAAPAHQRVAPVMRSPRSADDSLELPASLKKSNKGLYIGLGAAMVAAAAVLVVHGAMSSTEPSAGSSPTSTSAAAATATVESQPRPPAPPVPPPPAVTATTPPPAQASLPTVTPASLPLAAPLAQRNTNAAAVTPAPRPQPHPPAAAAPPPVTHHPAPRTPPKATGGGIVRDNPF
ncbi:MAG: hypothetical protein ACLQVI_07970 [Polyangiaceae bacterium]